MDFQQRSEQDIEKDAAIAYGKKTYERKLKLVFIRFCVVFECNGFCLHKADKAYFNIFSSLNNSVYFLCLKLWTN